MTARPQPALPPPRLSVIADDLAILGLLAAVAAVLTAAMVFQYGFGEIPCPLCLIERIAMFGICFASLAHFRGVGRARSAGLGLVAAVLLLVVSVRQVLLDICPRPGHDYVGSAVLGLHMPVWSVLVALGCLAAHAARLAVLNPHPAAAPGRAMAAAARIAGLYVTALCALNLASAVVQCGFGQCHTSGYVLLHG